MKNSKTAAELMAELLNKPEFQRKAAAREELRESRQARYDELLAPVIGQLGGLGLRGDSLQKIVELNAPLSVSAIDVLRNAIPCVKEARPRESIVRALGAASVPFDGRCLAECFDSTDDESLRWAIANTISMVKPHSIDAWVEEKLGHPTWGVAFRDLRVSG